MERTGQICKLIMTFYICVSHGFGHVFLEMQEKTKTNSWRVKDQGSFHRSGSMEQAVREGDLDEVARLAAELLKLAQQGKTKEVKRLCFSNAESSVARDTASSEEEMCRGIGQRLHSVQRHESTSSSNSHAPRKGVQPYSQAMTAQMVRQGLLRRDCIRLGGLKRSNSWGPERTLSEFTRPGKQIASTSAVCGAGPCMPGVMLPPVEWGSYVRSVRRVRRVHFEARASQMQTRAHTPTKADKI